MGVYKDLLGHNLEKFAGVTVFDATFYDGNNRPLITFDTLTVSNIMLEAEQKEIRGGQGANLLSVYDYGKTAEVEITDALASMFSLQYLTGGRVKDEFTALIRREAQLVEDAEAGTKVWKLPVDAVDGAKATLLITEKDGTVNQLEDIEIVGNTVQISNLDPDKVIAYYEAKFTGAEETGAPSHVRELTITANDFPPVVKMVGETRFVDVKTGRLIHAQIEIPKFKLAANFELTFEAEGDASVFDFSGIALADGNDIIKIKTLGYFDETEVNYNQGDIDKGQNPEKED